MVRGMSLREPIMLDDSLQAGYLLPETGSREYAAFELQSGDAVATLARICTPEERKRLRKMVHGERIVHSIPFVTTHGEKCLLFTKR